MNKFVETKLIPLFSFLLGLSLCTSTALMSTSYAAVAALALFRGNFLYHFKLALKNKYVVGGLLVYLVFLIAMLWTNATWHDSSKMLLRLIAYLLLPLFVMSFSVNNSAKLLIRGFLIGAIIICILSILSAIFNHHILFGIYDHTWVIFHGHILHNAFLAVAASFYLLAIMDSGLNQKTRIWYLIAYILCFIDIMFVVNGRTGQLMLLAMSGFIFVYRFKLKGILILVGASVIIAPLLYFSPMVQKGIKDYQSDNQKYAHGDTLTSVGLRYEFHQKSIELIKRSPIIGYGTGSFTSTYKNYTNFSGARATTNPHCDWLWFGVETGALGIAVYTLFLILTLINIRRLSKGYKCIGYTLLLGYLLAGIQNSFFIDNVTGVAYIVIMAAIMVAGSKDNFPSVK